MGTRGAAQRRDEEPAFVLHTYAYRETSLIVEVLTAAWGRVAMVARGARRPRSELRGLLQGFQPLLLSWSGAAEMKTLQRAEWRGGLPRLGGPALLCGFYLNELLLKLLPREDPHPELYVAYEAALVELAAGAAQAPILRRFELDLLAGLGYALPLANEAGTGVAIDPGARYHYRCDSGPVRLDEGISTGVEEPWPGTEPRPGRLVVSGAALLALDARRFDDAALAAEAKRLMREVLDHHLEQRGIESRRLLQDLQALN